MSATQTFILAHKARSKLSREASKPDHDLRHLVLTANLLDSVMLHLSQAEQEQEAWFNGMVREGSHEEAEVRASPQLGTISEESAQLAWASEYSSDSDSDSEDEDEDKDEGDEFNLDEAKTVTSQFPMLSSERVTSIAVEVDEEEGEEDGDYDEDDGFYSLQRMPSRAPSLVEDTSDSDDEETNPPSPRQTFAVPALTKQERQSLVTTSFYGIASEDDSPVSYLDESVRISASLVVTF